MNKSTLLLLLGSFLSAQTLEASEWPLSKGAFQVELSGTFHQSSKVFDNDGQLKSTAKLSFQSYQTFVRYGINDQFTLIGGVPFLTQIKVEGKSNNDKSVSTELSAPGDAQVGFEYLFAESELFRSTVGFRQFLPTGKNDGAFNLRSGYADWSQKITVGERYQRSPNWYLQGNMGLIHRNQGISDAFVAGAEWSFNPQANFRITAQVDGEISLENGRDEGVKEHGALIAAGDFYGLYEQNAGHLMTSLHIESLFLPNQSGISAGIGYIVRGENNISGLLIQAGLIINLGKKQLTVPESSGN